MRLKKAGLLFLYLVSNSPFATDYIINLPEPLKDSAFSLEIQSFFNDLYQKIDIKPTYVYTSVNRGFKSMKKGEIHAEAYRTNFIGNALGETFKINSPLANVKVALFCNSNNLCDINPGYSYAIQRGFSYGSVICEELKINCKFVPSSTGLAKLLDKKIVDAIISPYPAYKFYLCKSKSEVFYYQNIPEYFFNIYHFTNIENPQTRLKLKQILVVKLKVQSKFFAAYSGKPNLSECNKKILPIPHTE